MFRKKQKLRKQENAQLFKHLEEQKEKLDSEKQLIQRSIDPSDDVLNRAKVTEAVYSFLLREARKRQVSKNELR
ncbi:MULTISPECIES: YaaL family protein [Halalkalibacter]|uniref:YaaL family protein n=1 Tax=Halalkalibacter alkaliphilus TaxID=2917993 RepID=A0A9X2I7P6_9BACI|nr:YaaL family protein [Halalkalibacter alkaliphilus]MCL7749886.1 YaaL family protein [Halalkalibacter alkaliphilus]